MKHNSDLHPPGEEEADDDGLSIDFNKLLCDDLLSEMLKDDPDDEKINGLWDDLGDL